MKEFEGNKTLLPLVAVQSPLQGKNPILTVILSKLPPGPKAVVVNHKKEDVVIGVEETLYRNWELLSHNMPYEKIDANTIRFNVKVPKGGEAKVKYLVQIGV